MSETMGGVASKGATMAVKYVPPVLGFATGYMVGDVFNISGMVAGALTMGGADAGSIGKISILLTSGICAMIAIFIWKAIDHMIGNFFAGFFLGLAVRGAIRAVKT